MEQIEFKNSRGLTLVGELYPSDSNTVIVMAHGLTGDKHEGGRFDKAAEVLQGSFSIFKFDFSGCGESEDDTITVEKEVDDLKSAIQLVRSRGLTDIALLGLSLGALVSVRVYDESIKAMVLWAPVTNAATTPEVYYGSDKVKELEETGVLTRIRKNAQRVKVVIGKQLFDEWKSINQQQLLSRIKIPVLIIHGDQDSRIPLSDSQKALEYLPTSSKLEVVEGSDHIFNNRVDVFIDLTKVWFRHHLE